MKVAKGKENRFGKRWHQWMAALFFVIPLSLSGQCISGNCQDDNGVYIYANGEKYVGHFVNGKPDGNGLRFYTDGSRYQGDFKLGLPEGNGTKVLRDGTRLEGAWERGFYLPASAPAVPTDPTLVARGYGNRTGCISGDCVNGEGVYIFENGNIYNGQFANGEIHGQGICYYNDKSQYKGSWQHRYPHGQGTKTWPDGRSRQGEWRHGQPVSNNGQYLDPIESVNQAGAAAVQSGCLRGNCGSGQGYYAYPDGSRYEGTFQNSQPDGRGIFYYPNGDRYEGGFRNGYRHGIGIWQPVQGQPQQGQWENGVLLLPNQAQNGCISGNCQNAFGTYVFREGDKYIGPFVQGKPEGTGEVIYQNGDRYEGSMSAGAFEGYGTYYEKNGNMRRGYWRQGHYMGDRATTTVATPAKAPDLKVWAVIIGVSAYSHMPALRYPDDDAYRIFAFLQSAPGGGLPDEQIRILIDEDATKANIKDAMRDVFFRAGKNDLVLLYFSGHGLPGSFLPIDYDGVNNILYHEEIRDILAQSPARYKLCLADACHSGSLLTARGGQAPDLLTKYYESLATANPGTALMMSSKTNETSLESSGLRQGVFSHYLLRGYKGEADVDGNKIVTVQELFNFVQRNVRAYTTNLQSPVMQGDYDPNMTVGVVK